MIGLFRHGFQYNRYILSMYKRLGQELNDNKLQSHEFSTGKKIGEFSQDIYMEF